MSNAKTVCPECGKVTVHKRFEGTVEEFGSGKTKCDCGHEYDNFPNVSLNVPNEEVSAANS